MSIQTYFGNTMRHALDRVQEALGPDAMIIATRRVADGVEIEASLAAPEVEAAPSITPTTANSDIIHAQSLMLKDVQAELARLRGMVENSLSPTHTSEDTHQQHPIKTTIFSRLSSLGFSTTLSQTLVANLAEHSDITTAWQQIRTDLINRCSVPDIDIIDQTGVIAMVGPTGVGKTTTIAKLAARFTMKYGPDDIGLITADFYRVAGREQLVIYGRILDIPVHRVNNVADLNQALSRLKDKRLILIDTAGISQRDPRLAHKLAMITELNNPLSLYLVLAATSQAAVLEESVRAFQAKNLKGVIATKVDESPVLGHLLSLCIQERLPIASLATGQNVPEDMQTPTKIELINQALNVENKKRSKADAS